MRHTSINAYHEIRTKNLLSKLRFRVYDYLFHNGPLTQGEVSKNLYIDRNTSSPRFAELKARGVIVEVGERQCSTTGRNVLVWDVTENLPAKVQKKLTIKEQLETALAFIEDKGLSKEFTEGAF